MATMFTNPYDAQLEAAAARRKEMRDVAQMGAYDYHAYQAGLGSQEAGRALGGMLGMQTPEAAKQNKIQEIMGQFGEGPKTPEQLLEIADSFRQAGMLDLWKEATDAAEKQSRTALNAKSTALQHKSLEMKQEEHEANKRVSQLQTNYKHLNEAKDIQFFLQGLYPEKVKELSTITTVQKAKEFLSTANEAAGHTKGLNHDMLLKHVKFNRDSYVNKNKWNPVEELAKASVRDLSKDGDITKSTKLLNPVPSGGYTDIDGVGVEAVPGTTTEYIATEDKSQFIPLGTQATPGITQVDPEASALDKVLNPPIAQAAEDLKGILSNTFSTIDVQGSDKSEYDMTKAERSKENKLDALRDFLGNGSILTSSAHQYFSKNPKELVKFNKNPMMWFMKNVSPKGYDYSEYNLLGN